MEPNTKYIIAYLEGQLSENELEKFNEQLKNSKTFSKEVEEISFIWRTSAELKLHDRIDTARKWSEISKKIKVDKFRSKLWQYTQIAASILLLPLLSITIYFFSELKNISNNTEYTEVRSAHGSITKTSLPDGTEVWLNSGSTLIYPQTFESNKRVVKLFGEAYFKVSSDKKNRFDVQIQNELVVSAYGTEFNIDAYVQDSVVNISLLEGNVEVKQTDGVGFIDLLPGKSLTYHKTKKTMQAVTDANLYAKTAWKDGKIIFRRTNMAEVAQRLSTHFNVEIRLEGKDLYDYEYSGTFITETLNEILYLLEKTAPIKYEIIEPQQSSDDYSFTKRIVVIKLRK